MKARNKVVIKQSTIGRIHDEYILGNISEADAKERLSEEVGKRKAASLLDKWREKVLKCGFLSSSVDKAVGEAEDYLGTLAENATVSCQDVITEADRIELERIAKDNGVSVQVGRYSATYFDAEEAVENLVNRVE